MLKIINKMEQKTNLLVHLLKIIRIVMMEGGKYYSPFIKGTMMLKKSL